MVYGGSDPSTVRKKIQDILQDIWKKITGHLTRLQKPISLHLLGTIVSQQYSKRSETFCKCIVHFVQTARPDVNHHKKITDGQFFVDQIRHCRVHIWPIDGRQHNKLVVRYQQEPQIQENTGHKRKTRKYRTATKIQEFTGFTGPLGSLWWFLQHGCNTRLH